MLPLLKTARLGKYYGGGRQRIRALADVDLEVYAGETLGLVGESGCGKTTLARCALRLIEPSSGTVEFDGVDLVSLEREALRRKRREFQFIFQDAAGALDPRMTIREILAEPYDAHGLGTPRDRKEWTDELLDLVGLDRALAGRLPGKLSGGQQQRVGIARALALKPRLLIADEPVSALDASVQAQVLNLLAGLRERFNLTLILISHSLAVVHYLCSRIVVMYLGRIVEEAPVEAFFREPRHPYSRMLLASTPGLQPQPDPLSAPPAGELPSPAKPPSGCAFHPRCPVALPRCGTETPPLHAVQAGERVACFLYT